MFLAFSIVGFNVQFLLQTGNQAKNSFLVEKIAAVLN